MYGNVFSISNIEISKKSVLQKSKKFINMKNFKKYFDEQPESCYAGLATGGCRGVKHVFATQKKFKKVDDCIKVFMSVFIMKSRRDVQSRKSY